MTTRAQLEAMKMPEIAKAYGIKYRPGTTKAALIDRVLASTTVTTGNLTATTITLSEPLNPSVSATVPYIDVPRYGAKQGRPLPAIVIRTPDGPQVTWTPLGSGIWREENTATGDVRECDGGLDATWDGTTLVIANFYADEWGHPAPFDPLIAPYVEVPDAADAE